MSDKKETKKIITQVKVFSLIETSSGEAMLNGFLGSNKIVNITTNVTDGHVSAIVIYTMEIPVVNEIIGEQQPIKQTEIEPIEILDIREEDKIEFPKDFELKGEGNNE